MSGLSQREISELYNMFSNLHSAFDGDILIKEFIFNSNKPLHCLICKKNFISPHEVVESPECVVDFYHPKNFSYKLERASEKTDRVNISSSTNNINSCLHEGCQKKILKNEMNCCHKNFNSLGCLLGDGKHMIVISEKYE
jgi:hypothetical protein